MNCEELAAILEETLLRQRDAAWLREAREHAQHCSACARQLELQVLEERLVALPAMKPSDTLVATVLSRIQPPREVATVAAGPDTSPSWGTALVVAGGGILTIASCVQAVGNWKTFSWFTRLWPMDWEVSLTHLPGTVFSTSLAQQSPWLLLWAGVATALILLGFAVSADPASRSK